MLLPCHLKRGGKKGSGGELFVGGKKKFSKRPKKCSTSQELEKGDRRRFEGSPLIPVISRSKEKD